ncbi:MAG: DUF2147 domain-containing protein [Chlorobiaceae bacterium]|nr:DUF2147 domain-containing protein [Chlorobiaceae bacterium]
MNRIVVSLLAGLLLCFASVIPVSAGTVASEDVVGKWQTFRDGRHRSTIEIYRNENSTYEGRIVWGETPGLLDSKNPDPAKRGQVLVGQVILRDFVYAGENSWKKGRIYDPDSGHEYSASMQLDDDGRDRNTLRLRGFIGISLFGRTEKWTREGATAAK